MVFIQLCPQNPSSNYIRNYKEQIHVITFMILIWMKMFKAYISFFFFFFEWRWLHDNDVVPNLKLEINYEEKGWELCPRDHLQFLSLFVYSVIYMWVIIYDISAKKQDFFFLGQEMKQLYSIHYQVLKSRSHMHDSQLKPRRLILKMLLSSVHVIIINIFYHFKLQKLKLLMN